MNTDHDHIWEWALSFDRVFDIRVKISHWIHSRWKSRAHAIQMKTVHIPPVTELICHRGIQDPGTMDQPTQTPDVQQLPPEDSGNGNRRGPARACKKKKE